MQRRTPLGASYDTFGSERYVLTFDNRALRERRRRRPTTFVVILVNGEHYGGGGIYNLFATVRRRQRLDAVRVRARARAPLRALADEYYTSDVAYETRRRPVEPWEPNITALLDPAALKWRDLVAAGHPVPTPWGKEEYEKRSAAIQAERRALRASHAPRPRWTRCSRDDLRWSRPFLPGRKHGGKVGAFEGAGYLAGGSTGPRPTASCSRATWTASARSAARAIERVIDLYAGSRAAELTRHRPPRAPRLALRENGPGSR